MNTHSFFLNGYSNKQCFLRKKYNFTLLISYQCSHSLSYNCFISIGHTFYYPCIGFHWSVYAVYSTIPVLMHITSFKNHISPTVINSPAIQFTDINALRAEHNLPPLGDKEVMYLGRHHYTSRSRDGYNINDMWLQVESAMSAASVVSHHNKMTRMINQNYREDGYGNYVHDMAVLELTSRLPRSELYSLIPKGDLNKPILQTQKGPP